MLITQAYPRSVFPVRCTAKHQRLLHEGVQACILLWSKLYRFQQCKCTEPLGLLVTCSLLRAHMCTRLHFAHEHCQGFCTLVHSLCAMTRSFEASILGI